MTTSLLCFVWDESGSVSLRREPAQFLRDHPSGFECDLRLRPPCRAVREGTPALAVTSLFLCRHVASCIGRGGAACPQPDEPAPHQVALVKSSLQKAVRRGHVRAAVAAAAYLLAREPKELLRRLPVIFPEDVGVCWDLPKLTWLMVAAQSGYALNEADMRFILTLVAVMAAHPVRIEPPNASDVEADAALASLLRPAASGLGNAPTVADPIELLAQCFVLRACYGGMSGDVEMLLSFAAKREAWAERIVPTVESTSNDPAVTALVDEWMAAGTQKWCMALARSEQLEAAADFHCTDIVPRLQQYLRSRGLVSDADCLKAVIWTHRSSLNFRGPMPSEPLPSWCDVATEHELARLSASAWAERPSNPTMTTANEGAATKRRRSHAGASSVGTGKRQLSILRFAGGPANAGA